MSRSNLSREAKQTFYLMRLLGCSMNLFAMKIEPGTRLWNIARDIRYKVMMLLNKKKYDTSNFSVEFS